MNGCLRALVLGVALSLAVMWQAGEARAGQVTVAVATNFLLPAREIAAAFQAETGHDVVLVGGSSGKLAAQVLAGAPFDVLLSGDAERVDLLAGKGALVTESRVTYAIGRLVLWSPDKLPLDGPGLGSLKLGGAGRLAIANAKLAPYGLAARQALASAGVLKSVEDRLVFGENIGQTFAIVASGNARAGLVALSQLKALKGARGHMLLVRDDMHEPIRQDGAQTQHGAQNAAARAFLMFLRSAPARGIILKFGYASDD